MNQAFVVHSSVVLAWLLEDQQTPATETLLNALPQGARVVSVPLLSYDVAQALLTAQNLGRLSDEQRRRLLAFFDELPIEIDEHSAALATGATVEIASKHQLSLYRAAYLELAMRYQLPLAALDVSLRRAAQAEAVSVLA